MRLLVIPRIDGLEFMGREWDKFRIDPRKARWAGKGAAGSFGRSHPVDTVPMGMRAFQEWTRQWAEQAYRILKPGGHMLVFGGTRTHHRMICGIEDAGFEIRDCLMWIYASGFPKSLDVSKAIDKEKGAKRKKIKHKNLRNPKSIRGGEGIEGGDAPYLVKARERGYHELDSDEPVTEEAAYWQGWGTGLKPAHEIILWASKHVEMSAEQRTIVENLSKLEDQLWSLLPANVAIESFGLSPAEYEEVCDSAQWNAEERSNTQDVLSDLTDTSQFVLVMSTCLNTVMSWRRILVGNSAQMSVSIIETELDQTIGWKTLKSCSSVLTPRSIIKAVIHQPGSWWNVLPAARLLNAAAANIASIHELSVLANAIEKGHTSHQVEGDLELTPDSQPIVLARKAIGEQTVAKNILRWGTGALNIAGCRIESGGDYHDLEVTQGLNDQSSSFNVCKERRTFEPDEGGRWPPNTIFDEDAAEQPECKQTQGPSRGGASRFFFVPKPTSAERHMETAVGKTENLHPTLKPVALMQYLVRLITPAKGVVLDPFMGSGSTLIAAAREGFSGLGIEKDADSVKIAAERVKLDAPLFNKVEVVKAKRKRVRL